MGLSLSYTNISNRVVEVQTITTDGPQVFTLTEITYNPGTQQLQVYVNGILKVLGVDYTETSSTKVTFLIDPLNTITIQDTVQANQIVFVSSTVAVFPNFASADMTNLTAAGQTVIKNLVATAGGGAAIDLSNVNWSSVSTITLQAMFNAMKAAGVFAAFLGD